MKARRKLISKKRNGTQRTREESKRFASTVSTGLVVVGAVVALVAVANKWMSREELRGFRIEGRTILDSSEIVERAAVPDSLPLTKIDLEEIEIRLKGHPFISNASVYRGENGTLVMEIEERAPVAVTFLSGSPVYLDSAATALPYRFSSAAFDVPVVAGVENGERLDSVKALEAITVAREIRSYDDAVYRQLSEIRRDGSGEYTLVTAEQGVSIRVGGAVGIAPKLGKLDLFLRTLNAADGHGRIRYVDLRWKGQIVVRWVEQQV